MNYFITGGLDFVGRHLSSFLLKEGNRVTAFGYMSINRDGVRKVTSNGIFQRNVALG